MDVRAKLAKDLAKEEDDDGEEEEEEESGKTGAGKKRTSRLQEERSETGEMMNEQARSNSAM